MALIYSLAETVNIGWSVATGKAAGSLDERIQDLAFRREVLTVVRDELKRSRLPTLRELSKLLEDESFFALAVDLDNPSARSALAQRAVGDAFEGLDEDAQTRLLSALAASVAAVALRSADPVIRLLNAKLDDVTAKLLTLLDTQPDLLTRLDQALQAAGPPATLPVWMSDQHLSGGLNLDPPFEDWLVGGSSTRKAS